MAIFLGVLLLALGAVTVLVGIRSAAAGSTDPERYLRSLDWSTEEVDEFQQLLSEPFLTRVLRPIAARLLGTMSGALPRNYRDGVHEQLVRAGLTGRYRAEEIVTAQALCGLAGLVLAVLLVLASAVTSNVGVLLVVLFPLFGVQLPRTILRRRVEERQCAIRRDLPDTLDLLAISVEAGVGFEGALAVVSESFQSPLADEFSRTLREMELGLPRRQALENMKRRTEVPELSNFILTLTQADALGMPVGRVLKTQAGEMRLRRRQWAREQAAKLPVKILFPLLPILLATFVVVLGPAGATIGAAFD